MKITFRKISRYTVPTTSAQVAALLMGEWDPPALRNKPQITDEQTFCSTALRARMSVAGPQVIYTEQLAEIKFDPVAIFGLKSCTISSRQVREAFIAGWVNDQLAESRQDIIREVIDVLELAKQYSHCLVISHTFRLTVIRAYLIEGEKLTKNSDLIRKYIQPENKLMAFDQEFVDEY